MMVTLTEIAANEIKRQLADADDAGAIVRLGVEAGGCSGAKYVITPGSDRQPGDCETTQFELTILCDPISLTAFEGLKVDFVDAFVGGGFRYDNPKAARSCGCGVSFKAAPETGKYAK
jgi:iron-sulfur cluster assembly protein